MIGKRSYSKYTRFLVLSAATITLSVACKSTPKSEDTSKAEGQPMDAQVSSEKMNYDATGSDSGKIDGLHTVHFDYDQANLGSDARKDLGSNAEWIKAHTSSTVQIEGHCDKRGSTEYNLALGERRAKAVKTYLANLGIKSKRLTVISYGEEKPLDPADSEEAFAKNRRANFVPLNQ
jgi:peptidoglycan-associated lipoprotein